MLGENSIIQCTDKRPLDKKPPKMPPLDKRPPDIRPPDKRPLFHQNVFNKII